MRINSCKTNHIVNPMGYAAERVVFSWIAEETRSAKPTAARILVSSDPKMRGILYDSGYDPLLSGIAAEVPVKPAPYTRYYWTVEVRGDCGDGAVSGVNRFETGKMGEPWLAQWITPSFGDKGIHPYMRKDFTIRGRVKSARAYVTGMGLYELEINGTRVGCERLTPYCNAYDSWVQYQTYDVTGAIREGGNAVGAMLGNGWAKGRFGLGKTEPIYCDSFALLCELRIITEDGDLIVIGSGPDWKCAKSPVAFSGIYDGEVYDANAKKDGWSLPGYGDSGWETVNLFDDNRLGPVTDRLSLPVVVKETVSPIALILTPAGERVLDMGQNMVGWLKFRIREPKGAKIKLSYGEVLQGGNFYRDNLRSAKQEYTYVSDGTDSEAEPLFTFYGFRYVKLEGFSSEISLDDFTGCVIYSDMERTGEIETSDPLINRLFQNALWGQKGNFVDVPTDCPQRDERLGWTGDTQVFSGAASYNMDTYAFYAKFLRDLYEEQKGSDGMVHHFVPTFSPRDGRKEGQGFGAGGGACAWADCATIVPWTVYLHTGDKSILADQYDSMKNWVEWIYRQDEGGGGRRLWTTGFHFGDWLALDGPGGSNPMGGTDVDFLASAFYKLSSEILAKAANVLGRGEDAAYYGALSEQVRQAILDEFFTKSGRIAIKTQTALVVALHFRLAPDEMRGRVFNDLAALLKKDNMHLKTGFIGTPYLCRVLSENGAPELAYRILLQEDYPGWLYAVKLGATTIWERWNSLLPDGTISDTGMNSLNHYSYGSIVEWMYRHMCGIQPVEAYPGFVKFSVKPEIYGGFRYARARVRTAAGLIESGWDLGEAGECVTINVNVPFGAEAEIYLPNADIDEINAGGYGCAAIKSGSHVKLTAPAGSYTFRYRPVKNYALRYTHETPLAELLASPEARQALADVFPHLPGAGDGRMPYSIASMDPGMQNMVFGTSDFTALDGRLAKIRVPIRIV